jgi:hypothetical protein
LTFGLDEGKNIYQKEKAKERIRKQTETTINRERETEEDKYG